MDSKNIKVTRRSSTLRRFKHTDLACTIEARLRASANTGPTFLTKKERWILSEWLVAQDRLSAHNEVLYYHQYETPYAEVDLIFGPRDAGVAVPLTMIEVKAASALVAQSLWGRDSILSSKQLARLERARWMVELKAKRPVRLLLAVVDPPPSNRIRYFEAPFS